MKKVIAHDGADGLATGVAAIVAGACALLPGIRDFSASSGPSLGIAAWAIAGASVAFLGANFPPADLFLGDSGSTVLGFALACLALAPPGVHSPAPARLFFLPFAAALPMLDLVFGVLRRARAGRPPFFGDRRHLCDVILSRGWPARRMALACYTVTASLAGLGWLGLRAGVADFAVVSGLAIGALAWGGIRLGALRMNDGPLPKTTSMRETGELELSRGGRSSV